MEFIRKRIGLILRVLISGGILAFLAMKLDWAEFTAIVKTASVSWLLAGLGLIGLTIFLAARRWQMLLRVQGIQLSYSKVFQLNMIGQFFNAFLLGVTGGDVIKIYYAAQAAPEKRSAAGLSVIYDRILGLLGIIVWGVILTTTCYSFLTSTAPTYQAVWTFLFISAAAFGGIGLALILPWLRQNAGLWKLEQKLPFHGTIERLSEAFQRYARAHVVNLSVLIFSVFIHFFLFVTMFCVARSIGIEIGFWTLAAIASVVNVLIAIPVSISGLGVREGLFAVFLSLLSIPHEQAVAFSLLGFALSLVWSLIGGLIYLRYKKPGEKVTELAAT